MPESIAINLFSEEENEPSVQEAIATCFKIDIRSRELGHGPSVKEAVATCFKIDYEPRELPHESSVHKAITTCRT